MAAKRRLVANWDASRVPLPGDIDGGVGVHTARRSKRKLATSRRTSGQSIVAMKRRSVASKVLTGTAGGVLSEWHVDLSNSFYHIEFYFLSWFVQKVVPSRSVFSLSRFNTIRSITNTVICNALE